MIVSSFVYGNTDGLCLNGGSDEDYRYFSQKTNGILARERRLDVERQDNGKTYYNFLRYGTQECPTKNSFGRKGGLFGMSLVLDDYYYIYDIVGLLKHFDNLLDEIISRNILLKRDNNNVLHFLVNDFTKTPNEIKWLKGEIQSFINDKDIKKYDDSFFNVTSLGPKIGDSTDNDSIINIFKQYKKITIAKQYQVIYKIDGEIYGEIERKFFGANITRRQKPSKEGYDFMGWNSIPKTVPDYDVIIEGEFVPSKTPKPKFTITHIINGEKIKEDQLEEGSIIEHPSLNTKDGDIFSGWDSEYTIMPRKDIEIYGTITKATNKNSIKQPIDTPDSKLIGKCTNDSEDICTNTTRLQKIVLICAVIILVIMIPSLLNEYCNEPNNQNTTTNTDNSESVETRFLTYVNNNQFINAYSCVKNDNDRKILKDAILNQLTQYVIDKKAEDCKKYLKTNEFLFKELDCINKETPIENSIQLCLLIISEDKLNVKSDVLGAMLYNTNYFLYIINKYKGNK